MDAVLHSAVTIAQALLYLSKPENGDIISNLKLQKLLYYAQGLHIAVYNKPLFEEPIKAWTYGPVVEEVYHAFKEHGQGAIPTQNTEQAFNKLNQEQQAFLQEVYLTMGQYSAVKLMELTHQEMPWVSTESKQVITHQKLQAFFKTWLVNNE